MDEPGYDRQSASPAPPVTRPSLDVDLGSTTAMIVTGSARHSPIT